MQSLLQSIEEWVRKQPVLTLTVQVLTSVSINITILDISTVVSSGDADFSSGDGMGSTGSGTESTDSIEDDKSTTTETNQIGDESTTSFGVVCTPSAITFLSFIFVDIILSEIF